MNSIFLQAEWRKLAMANYVVDPASLRKYVPYKTELDIWKDTCYVSLVGFMFINTRLKGYRIPYHIEFEEVNLRFYVRYRENSEWKRGVVFIKEIVPRPALTLVANWVYGENYETMPMRHNWEFGNRQLHVEYNWKKGTWNSFAIQADNTPTMIGYGSEEEFITEHYWGYTLLNASLTSEYHVEHPRWEVYKVRNYNINVDFERVYGKEWAFLSTQSPTSVFLAEGSEILVRSGKRIY